MPHTSRDITSTPAELAGIHFVEVSRRVRIQTLARDAGWMTIRPGPFGPSIRSQLRSRIEEQIERELVRRGAAGPGLSSDEVDFLTTLRDQLFRAQLSGCKGVVVCLDSLYGLLGPSGALGDEDSATLRQLASATETMPIAVWLSPADSSLPIYEAPKSLRTVLALDTDTTASTAPRASHRSPSPQALTDSSHQSHSISRSWRQLARELIQAEGPKPLREVENLFVSHFVPLSLIVARGQAGDEALRALQSFRESFERSYRDAFSALRITGRRPLMTVDLPELLTKLARLHGARNSTLLLVDSLRYDLGTIAEPLLVERLRGTAVLADRKLVWAALPSTSAVQMQLIARGPRALKNTEQLAERASTRLVVPQGKNASVIRRLRLSGREFYKLDVIRSGLLGPGPPEAARLEQLAATVVDPIERFARELPARNLLLVVGDHGFLLPGDSTGSGPASTGGATPEEVLVPAFVWLVGQVH